MSIDDTIHTIEAAHHQKRQAAAISQAEQRQASPAALAALAAYDATPHADGDPGRAWFNAYQAAHAHVGDAEALKLADDLITRDAHRLRDARYIAAAVAGYQRGQAHVDADPGRPWQSAYRAACLAGASHGYAEYIADQAEQLIRQAGQLEPTV